jgi:phosphoglycolate phosphatase
MLHKPHSAPLLVFDLDGTLADTAGDLINAVNVVLQGEGLPKLDVRTGRPLVGGGARALIKRALASHGISVTEARLDEMVAVFLDFYEAHIADETVLFDGAKAALDRFEAAGYAFAVCTNKVEHAAVLLLSTLGVADRFRAICGKDTFSVSKPHKMALIETIARAGGDPRRAIMIGDSKTDVETARNADIPIVGVTFGYTEQPIATFEPDRVIAHYDELWDAVATFQVA